MVAGLSSCLRKYLIKIHLERVKYRETQITCTMLLVRPGLGERALPFKQAIYQKIIDFRLDYMLITDTNKCTR